MVGQRWSVAEVGREERGSQHGEEEEETLVVLDGRGIVVLGEDVVQNSGEG